jgi:hypothetical protein
MFQARVGYREIRGGDSMLTGDQMLRSARETGLIVHETACFLGGNAGNDP